MKTYTILRLRGHWKKDVPAVQGEGKGYFLEVAGNKTSCHCCQTMKYCWIYDTLSLKQCIGEGDGRRDSDDEIDALCSVKSDAVAGTFNKHLKLQRSLECRLYVYVLSMFILFRCWFASRCRWYWKAMPAIAVSCILFHRRWPCIRMWADATATDRS